MHELSSSVQGRLSRLLGWWRWLVTPGTSSAVRQIYPGLEALEDRLCLSLQGVLGQAGKDCKDAVVSACFTESAQVVARAATARVDVPPAQQTGKFELFPWLALKETAPCVWESWGIDVAEAVDECDGCDVLLCWPPLEETGPGTEPLPISGESEEAVEWHGLTAEDGSGAVPSAAPLSLQSGSEAAGTLSPTSISLGKEPTVAPASWLVSNPLKQGTHQPTGTEQPAPFVICRSSPSSNTVNVQCDITTIDRDGQVHSQQQVIEVPGGTSSVSVPRAALGMGAHTEVVTLTVRSQPSSQTIPTTATWFVPGAARHCSDAALLQAYFRAGSQESFAALMERYRPVVLRIGQQVLGNYADAEDVSQNVFLLLATKPLRFGKPLASWLYAVARNAAISYLRSRTRRARHEARAARSEETRPSVAAHTLTDDVVEALTHLPVHYQQAVRLRYLEECSQQEAARIVGCPRGTLAQRAARGVGQLRSLLQRVVVEE